jgi:hypothetical protein
MSNLRAREIAVFFADMQYALGMKTEQKRTELSGAIFVFIFLCGSRNEYKNTENKYENEYFQK